MCVGRGRWGGEGRGGEEEGRGREEGGRRKVGGKGGGEGGGTFHQTINLCVIMASQTINLNIHTHITCNAQL